MRALVLLLLAATLATPSLGGSEADPEVSDAEGDVTPEARWTDITAAWLNETETDVVATILVASVENPPPVYLWYVLADVGDTTWGWGVAIDVRGTDVAPYAYYGTWDRAAGGPLDYADTEGGLETGTPARVVAHLPKRAIAGPEGLPAGAILTNIEALAGSGGTLNVGVAKLPPTIRVDDRGDGRDFVLAGGVAGDGGPLANRTGEDEALVPANASATDTARATPAGGAAAVVAGAVLALAARRR